MIMIIIIILILIIIIISFVQPISKVDFKMHGLFNTWVQLLSVLLQNTGES